MHHSVPLATKQLGQVVVRGFINRHAKRGEPRQAGFVNRVAGALQTIAALVRMQHIKGFVERWTFVLNSLEPTARRR